MKEMEPKDEKKSYQGCAINLGALLIVVSFFVGLWSHDFKIIGERKREPEAKTELKRIANRQLQYGREHGRFASHEDGRECFELIGWEAPAGHQYSYYCDTDLIPGPQGRGCPVPETAPDEEKGFIVTAVANLDDDPECDVWTINQKMQLVHVVKDVKAPR